MDKHTPASLAASQHLYSQVRSTIQTGDLLAWRITRSTSIFDVILSLYQKVFRRKFSHVAIAVRVGNRLFAVEAVPKAVRIIPLSFLDNFYLIRTRVPKSDKHFGLLSKHLGKPYSLWDLVKNILGFKGDDRELYCSELALKFYDEIGFFVTQVDEFDDRLPTPDDIVNRVLAETKGIIEFVRIDKGNIHDE